MKSDITCPDIRELKRLILGQVTEAEFAALERHVGGCAKCADTLSAIRVSDPFLDAVRAQGGVEPGLEGKIVVDLVAHLKMVPPLEPTVSQLECARQPIEDRCAVSPPGYAILGELGRGGMGVVYKARQVKANRTVALKMILAAGHADAAELSRFRTEAQVVARLQHPGIVQVFDVGEHQGRPYFAMEYVEGSSLQHKLQGTPLAANPAARLTLLLALAVQAAHDKGILHRDLKPANVFLQPVKTGGVLIEGQDGPPAHFLPKVGDFGLAKTLERESAVSTAGLTRTGVVMGTPSYMAPEQAQGKVKEMGPAADEYSLGAILYELLTGRPPFRAATKLETLNQVIRDEPVPPNQLNSKTPRDLETICLKCLQKDPKNRYATAQSLAEDLKRFIKGEPIRARSVGRIERTWRWCLRNRAVAGLLAAVAATLILGIAVSSVLAVVAFLQANEARREKQAAVAAQKQAKDNETRAEENEQTAKDNAQKALDSKKEEERQRLAAQKEAYQNAWMAYGSQIALVQSEWQDENSSAARQHLDATRWDFRGLEYRYLYTTLYHGYGQRTFADLSHPAMSADGKRIAAVSGEGPLNVIDADTGQEIFSVPTEKARVIANTGIVMSGDGKRVAAACEDNTVRIWDLDSPRESRALKRFSGQPRLVISADGKRVVTAHRMSIFKDNPAQLKIWDAETGAELISLPNDADVVFHLAISADGKRIAGGTDTTIQLWDADTGKLTSTITDFGRSMGFDTAVAFSNDGKRLAACVDTGIRIWDTDSGKTLLTIGNRPGGSQVMSSVAFSSDGSRLVTGGTDTNVRVWDAGTGQELLVLPGHTSPVFNVAIGAKGKRIVSGDATSVKIWDTDRAQANLSLAGHTKPVRFLALSEDGKSLVTLARPDSVASGQTPQTELKVWDTSTYRAISSDLALPFGARSVAITPDGKRVIVSAFWGAGADSESAIVIWDVASRQEVRRLKGSAGFHVLGLALSPDGKYVVSSNTPTVNSPDKQGGEYLGDLKVWNTETGQEVRTINTAALIRGIVWFPDSKRFIVHLQKAADTWNGGTLKTWDAETGAETPTFSNGPVSASDVLALSRDGRLVLISTEQGCKSYDLETGQELCTLKGEGIGHSFSNDGTRILGNHQGLVKLWDAGTGQQTIALAGHSGNVNAVALSRDGTRIFSAADNTVTVWDGSRNADALVRSAVSGHSPVAMSADGMRILTAGGDMLVKVWDAASGEELQVFSPPGRTATSRIVANISDDGKRVVCCVIQSKADDASHITVWDAATAQELLSYPLPRGNALYAGSISADGKYVALGYWDGTVQLWDVEARRQTLTGKIHTAVVNVSLSADGKRLVSRSFDARDDGTARLWDTATGESRALAGTTGQLGGVVISPDGKTVVGVSEVGDSFQNTIKAWDALTGSQLFTVNLTDPPKGPRGPLDSQTIRVLGFSADSKWFCGCTNPGGDPRLGVFKIWEVATGKEVLVSKRLNGLDRALLSSDRKRLVIAAGGTIEVRDVQRLLAAEAGGGEEKK